MSPFIHNISAKSWAGLQMGFKTETLILNTLPSISKWNKYKTMRTWKALFIAFKGLSRSMHDWVAHIQIQALSADENG